MRQKAVKSIRETAFESILIFCCWFSHVHVYPLISPIVFFFCCIFSLNFSLYHFKTRNRTKFFCCHILTNGTMAQRRWWRLQSDNQLLCGFACDGWYVGCIVCYVLQCIGWIFRQMVIRFICMRSMEQFRCVLFNNQHSTFMLHQRWSILCNCSATGLPPNHDLF